CYPSSYALRSWHFARSIISRRARTAGKDRGKILGREDAAPRRAHVGDGVDQPIGVVRGHERSKIIEWHWERHAQVQRRVTVDADTPTRWLQAPIGFHGP